MKDPKTTANTEEDEDVRCVGNIVPRGWHKCWQHLSFNPEQPSPSLEFAGEELETQKEVKFSDPGVEAEGVESNAEVAAAPQMKKKTCCCSVVDPSTCPSSSYPSPSFWLPFCPSLFCPLQSSPF
ncbi:hypothetical protein DAPPUDRAFT_120182 [Daphnia pulex]|uniref:Uncharacterized protein n=1 Tax=Daphnia pulex TaxID=6669 RepID=E9I0K0_DAPPU|nr:hypothetical protein DAPPUDRAFT_120182 [Daphnia pulex]|eukprot:EFX62481.1 hypothetical protein DAPPUDRAFT_120182 [Daphnia pulex]